MSSFDERNKLITYKEIMVSDRHVLLLLQELFLIYDNAVVPYQLVSWLHDVFKNQENKKIF